MCEVLIQVYLAYFHRENQKISRVFLNIARVGSMRYNILAEWYPTLDSQMGSDLNSQDSLPVWITGIHAPDFLQIFGKSMRTTASLTPFLMLTECQDLFLLFYVLHYLICLDKERSYCCIAVIERKVLFLKRSRALIAQ